MLLYPFQRGRKHKNRHNVCTIKDPTDLQEDETESLKLFKEYYKKHTQFTVVIKLCVGCYFIQMRVDRSFNV